MDLMPGACFQRIDIFLAFDISSVREEQVTQHENEMLFQKRFIFLIGLKMQDELLHLGMQRSRDRMQCLIEFRNNGIMERRMIRNGCIFFHCISIHRRCKFFPEKNGNHMCLLPGRYTAGILLIIVQHQVLPGLNCQLPVIDAIPFSAAHNGFDAQAANMIITGTATAFGIENNIVLPEPAEMSSLIKSGRGMVW